MTTKNTGLAVGDVLSSEKLRVSMGDNFLIAVLLFVQKEWVELMGHLLYDMCLQGIMVVVFIITVD